MTENFKCLINNNLTINKIETGDTTPDGKVWYGLVFTGEILGMDKFSACIFNIFINGVVYWFNVKKNRDIMFDWCIRKVERL